MAEGKARAAPSVTTIRREQKAIHATLQKPQDRFKAGYSLGASQALAWCLGLLPVKPSRMLQFLDDIKDQGPRDG